MIQRIRPRIPLRLEAIASRLEAIAIRLEAIANKRNTFCFFYYSYRARGGEDVTGASSSTTAWLFETSGELKDDKSPDGHHFVNQSQLPHQKS